MSLILEATNGSDLQLNVWSWGVIHQLVERAGILPEEVWAPKRHNGGGRLETAQVAALADFLEREVSRRVIPGKRMLLDGSVTGEPDDGTFYREPTEQWKNYSLDHDVLARLIEFLREANGPVTFY